jgi:hypothetical protein
MQMPSKSRAQFGEMGLLYSKGKITRKQLEDFNKGVHPNSLPEHVAKKHKAKPKKHSNIKVVRAAIRRIGKK